MIDTRKIKVMPLRMHEHTHVLIDRVLYQKPPASWCAEPVVNYVLAPQQELYPWLITLEHLSVEDTNKLRKLLNSAVGTPSTMLLHSNYQGKALIQRLADAMIYKPPAQQKRYLLRYYDSRVFLQISRMLALSQVRNFCVRAGVNYFSWSQAGECARFSITGIENRPEKHSEQTFERLNTIGLINGVLKIYNTAATLEETFSLSDLVEELIAVARTQFGLVDKNDLVFFALKGLEVHPQFYLTATIDRLLTTSQGIPGRFSSDLQLLTTDEWDSIRQASIFQRNLRTEE